MHNVRSMIAGRRGGARLLLRAAMVAAGAALVCGCTTDQQVTGASPVPTDYRLRHPITISEKDHTLQLFIGANRSSLMPAQRAELLAFAQSWHDHATGGVIVALPVGSVNERSSAAALREMESILAATGVPPQSVAVRNYRASAGTLATVRISYPRIAADAGPCGIWPEDIGPSMNRDYFENQPPWNFGCATQHNLAAMVADPADLVQPRAETPAYTMRRTTVMEKYRLGQPTATPAADVSPTAGRLSNVGQ
ncbi:MAG TPA: CpaD family pilus assembly protein [Xanthobacteraceae bacterium]|nr:CpaD family pilus assembly protein [Xanthobacteraceae bacterium]